MIKFQKQHSKYAASKETRVKWLNKIPENWEIVKLKYSSEVQFSSVDKHIYENEKPVIVCNYTDVYYGETINDNAKFRQGSCTQNEYAKFKVNKGDIIITKDSESADDIAIPAFIGKDLKNSVCGYHLALIKSKSRITDSKFLFRFFQNQGTRKYSELNANGVARFGLGKPKIKDLFIPIPSPIEQTAIVNYLDEKTALLDSIIEKKQKQIELLKERRSVLINRVVTQGIKEKVVFDTNAFDKFAKLSSTERKDLLKRIDIVFTHIQADELPNHLKEELETLCKVPTNGGVWNVSKWDNFKWGGADDVENINTVVGKGKKENHSRDALIANTAKKEDYDLVTDDKRLIKKCGEIGVKAISFNEMLENNKMKKSGVEWIKKVPKCWDVTPLFSIAEEQSDKNTGNRIKNVLSLSYGRIVKRDVETNFGLLPESFETYQIVDKGNIILRLTDLQNDKKSLRVGFVGDLGIITSAYVCLKNKESILPEYLYSLLHSYDLEKVFYGLGAGVRQTMKYSDLKRLPIPLPTLKEQRKIVDYLNSETSKIDKTIALIEKSITLLQEYKTSLISNVVTGKVKII